MVAQKIAFIPTITLMWYCLEGSPYFLNENYITIHYHLFFMFHFCCREFRFVKILSDCFTKKKWVKMFHFTCPCTMTVVSIRSNWMSSCIADRSPADPPALVARWPRLEHVPGRIADGDQLRRRTAGLSLAFATHHVSLGTKFHRPAGIMRWFILKEKKKEKVSPRFCLVGSSLSGLFLLLLLLLFRLSTSWIVREDCFLRTKTHETLAMVDKKKEQWNILVATQVSPPYQRNSGRRKQWHDTDCIWTKKTVNVWCCSGLLTVGELTWLEKTVGEVNRVEWKVITSIKIHSTGQD